MKERANKRRQTMYQFNESKTKFTSASGVKSYGTLNNTATTSRSMNLHS